MARFNPGLDTSETLNASRSWFLRCMVEDRSIFSEETLWSPALIDELVRTFVNRPDLGSDKFYVKLERQMQVASAPARRLMAEMLWVILLFQTRTHAETKREAIVLAWNWSGATLDPNHPLLSDRCLQGIGFPGQGYNNWRWKELPYLIEVARAFKRFDESLRRSLAEKSWEFASWLDGVPMEGYRQFRNILCYLVFPEAFERITVAHDKIDILAGLTGHPHSEFRDLGDLELSRRLADLRREITIKRGTSDFDFYEPDLRIRWKQESDKPESGAWLLSWNPGNWEWHSFDSDRIQAAGGQPVRMNWRCANSAARVGDVVYLTRTGSEPRGIIARGNVVKAPYEGAHYDPERAAEGEQIQYIDAEFTDIRDPSRDAFVETSVLAEKVSAKQEWSPRSSGIAISLNAAATLDALWKALPPVAPAVPHKGASREPVNEIAFGPPGTGKTYWLLTELLPQYEGASPETRRYEFITFHQSYSYEDFVEGIRPCIDSRTGNLVYEVLPGLFKRLCKRAQQDASSRYALFIDEVNRGNVARIFGELITLIEIDKRIGGGRANEQHGVETTLPYSGERFGVPRNLDIYATMNTADRSIALLDTALRRRFTFRELAPLPELITGVGDGLIPDGDGGEINLRNLLTALNDRIAYLLHRDQRIGHAYFMRVRDLPSLRQVLARQVLPLLQEMFYEDWGQIRLVLRDTRVPCDLQIVRLSTKTTDDVFGGANEDLADAKLFEVALEAEISADAIRKIYEPDG